MQILLKAVRWTSLISFPLFMLTIPNSPGMAGSIGSCADSMIASGVSQSAAAAACSDALEPDELAACVEEIRAVSNVKGDEALQGCYRVRRPNELASCVTTLSDGLEKGKSAMALDSCRRSLLPERHAECALDLASISKISSEDAMESCLAAELTPSEIEPETTEQ